MKLERELGTNRFANRGRSDMKTFKGGSTKSYLVIQFANPAQVALIAETVVVVLLKYAFSQNM